MHDLHDVINDICYIAAVVALIGILIFIILGDITVINAVKSGTDQDLVNATYFLGVATLFLGIIAILGPVISKWADRNIYAPKLRILFELSPPFCHQTKWRIKADPKSAQWRQEPVYYFRLRVKNEGRLPAKKCEVVLENLWICKNYIPIKIQNFSPVNLVWVAGLKDRIQYIDINPERGYFCDIGHISSLQYQREIEWNSFIDAPEYPACTSNDSHFVLDLLQIFNSQSNYLCPKTRYVLEIGLHSENASYQNAFFEIWWSGIWKDEQHELFKKEIIEIKPTEMPTIDRQNS